MLIVDIQMMLLFENPFLTYRTICCTSQTCKEQSHTVKAPNIAHISLLTSVEYNKKETKLKKCVQSNKVIIIYYLRRVQDKKYFPNL